MGLVMCYNVLRYTSTYCRNEKKKHATNSEIGDVK